MKTVLILKNTSASGKLLAVGETVDLQDSDAVTLIQLGKAKEATAPAPKSNEPAPVVTDKQTKKPSTTK